MKGTPERLSAAKHGHPVKISRFPVSRWLQASILSVVIASAPLLAARPKDYYFPEVRVEIAVSNDGSFLVDELRTFDFEGSFSAAWYTLPLEVRRQGYRYDVEVEDFRVFDEDGQPLRVEVSTSGGKFRGEWTFRASDEQRTFRIRYRVRKGILSYPDVSELYWQAIGEGWDRPTKDVLIKVTLPEEVPSSEDLLVYGHGPLSGRAEIIDARTARFTATNLRSGQFLEVRFIWPAGMVSGVPSTRHSRDSIREEEAGFVKETIERAQRAQAEAEEERKLLHLGGAVWGAWLVLGSLVWFLAYQHYWKKVGKDYHSPDIPDYYREPPSELRPALVEILLKEGGSISPRSFTATLFDLARRGYLEFNDRVEEKRGLFGTKEKLETSAALKKDYSADRDLLPYEKDLLGLLFETISKQAGRPGAQLEIDELREFLKKKPQTFQTWYLKWAKDIRTEASELHFIEPASLRTRNVFIAATIPLALLTLNPVMAVLGFVFIPRIKRRAVSWARESELWKALDRFLDDFSDFKELPPEAYKLWEYYLVFGILFGNAKKIIKMLPLILKDSRAAVPAWYYGVSGAALASTGRIAGMVQTIEAMATSIQQASTSAAHYSSGRGGGFSGGGGGGGGGSGGGAR